jgi:hypothetical protein
MILTRLANDRVEAAADADEADDIDALERGGRGCVGRDRTVGSELNIFIFVAVGPFRFYLCLTNFNR